MRTPTDVLRSEHEVILRALALLEGAAARPAGAEPPDDWWERAGDWLRWFADRSHHAKEERSLFPALIKAGLSSPGGPVDVLLEEHADARALVRAMRGAPAAARAARRYVALLRRLIDKENGVLFPLAEALLDERAMAAADLAAGLGVR